MWYRRVVPERGQPTTNTGLALVDSICFCFPTECPHRAVEGFGARTSQLDREVVVPVLRSGFMEVELDETVCTVGLEPSIFTLLANTLACTTSSGAKPAKPAVEIPEVPSPKVPSEQDPFPLPVSYRNFTTKP
jgi:hypothetical protein